MIGKRRRPLGPGAVCSTVWAALAGCECAVRASPDGGRHADPHRTYQQALQAVRSLRRPRSTRRPPAAGRACLGASSRRCTVHPDSNHRPSRRGSGLVRMAGETLQPPAPPLDGSFCCPPHGVINLLQRICPITCLIFGIFGILIPLSLYFPKKTLSTDCQVFLIVCASPLRPE